MSPVEFPQQYTAKSSFRVLNKILSNQKRERSASMRPLLKSPFQLRHLVSSYTIQSGRNASFKMNGWNEKEKKKSDRFHADVLETPRKYMPTE